MKIFPTIFIFTILFTAYSSELAAQSLQKESPAFFYELQKNEGKQLIDVRTKKEYKEGHLQNATLADWKNLRKFQKAVKKLNKEDTVYLYCRSGKRSHEAAKWLIENGFQQVVELEGGMLNYQKFTEEQ